MFFGMNGLWQANFHLNLCKMFVLSGAHDINVLARWSFKSMLSEFSLLVLYVQFHNRNYLNHCQGVNDKIQCLDFVRLLLVWITMPSTVLLESKYKHCFDLKFDLQLMLSRTELWSHFTIPTNFERREFFSILVFSRSQKRSVTSWCGLSTR